MNRIRTIIVDDEPLARKGLRTLLEKETDIDIVAECGNGEEALDAVDALSPDLLFLDIQMPEMNGMEVLSRIDLSRPMAIVFVTAYDQYALQAFELNALDYLLKPFTDERFETTLIRVKQYIKNNQIATLSKKLASLLESGAVMNPVPDSGSDSIQSTTAENTYLDKLIVKESGKMRFIKVDDIIWIGAEDYYAKIYTASASFLIRESLNKLEECLNPKKFLRIHRSSIVNSDTIVSLEQNNAGDYDVKLRNGTSLRLSRTRKHILRNFLPGKKG